jgi:hypothetical protein
VTGTRHASTVESGAIDIGVTGGELELSASAAGDLIVDRIDVTFDDIVLTPSELPPNGLTLTGISVRLAHPALAVATWYGDDVAEAEATVDVDFDWAILAPDGDLLPLGTQHVTGVDARFDVSSDAEGRVLVTIGAARDGQFWDWGGLVELSDLRLTLASSETR